MNRIQVSFVPRKTWVRDQDVNCPVCDGPADSMGNPQEHDGKVTQYYHCWTCNRDFIGEMKAY